MRRFAAAVALATVGVLLAGCGDDAPEGYTELGEVSGVPLYVGVSDDGFTVNTKFDDEELACEGSTSLNPDGITELCNIQTKDSYTYALAFPRDEDAPGLCDGRTYKKVKGTRLAGKKDWDFDVVAAVGRKPIFLTVCLEDLPGVSPSATP